MVKQTESNQGFQQDQSQLSIKDMMPGEILIGTLTGLDEQGNALINIAGNIVVAQSTVALNQQQSGRQVALLFVDGNPEKPIVMGMIHNPLHEMIENFEISAAEDQVLEADSKLNDNKEEVSTKIDDVYLDGERIVLEGKKEIVLKCGESSITLTSAGKIIIRGKYLLNRSSGVNRIMGGSVQVN